MKKKNWTEEDWDSSIRSFLKTLATQATNKRGAIDQAAKDLNLSRSAIAQMKSTGKGSAVSWIKMMMFSAGMKKTHVRDFFENFKDIMSNVEADQKDDELFQLFLELKGHYSTNELGAWFKLLINKSKIEKQIGVSLKAKKT